MAALTQASSLAPVELSWFSHLKWKPAWLPAPGGKIQFSSATQSCPTLCDPMDCSMPGFPVHHQLLELAQTHVHRIGDAIQPSHPLLSPPALNLSQHQGPNESALHIRWPKYWSFSFSISPSNDYSGLISFKIDWFDLLACYYLVDNSCPTLCHPTDCNPPGKNTGEGCCFLLQGIFLTQGSNLGLLHWKGDFFNH